MQVKVVLDIPPQKFVPFNVTFPVETEQEEAYLLYFLGTNKSIPELFNTPEERRYVKDFLDSLRAAIIDIK